MLSARAEKMEMEVVKAASTFDLWTGDPLVFRAILAPFFALGVLIFALGDHAAELVVLGDGGDEVELENPDVLVTDDDPDEVEVRAFVADSVYGLGPDDGEPFHGPYAVLMAVQAVVWCLYGTPTVLVLFGNHGGRVPDWAWEPESQGPHLKSVRITPLGQTGESR